MTQMNLSAIICYQEEYQLNVGLRSVEVGAVVVTLVGNLEMGLKELGIYFTV